jgi:hypothetical protein
LASLKGLEGLRSVATIAIHDSSSLSNLDALGGIASLGAAGGGYIEIIGNDNLTSIGGLSAVPNFSLYSLNISNNAKLPTLEGLNHLTAIASNALIASNSVLSSLRALGSLHSIAGSLSVTDNIALPTCEANWLVTSIGAGKIGSTVSISRNNDAGTCP